MEINSQDKSQSRIKVEPPQNSITLDFNNINYSLKGGSKRHILKNCSGSIQPGRLLVIIGSSGAGKSSLLNILAGRLRTNRKYTVTGEIQINGESNFKKEAFQQNTAYVLQQDLLYETLTPRETFDLSASLRLSRETSKNDKTRIVNKIIKSLSLETCADSLVGGNQLRGVSGGEMKRVCIGTELVTNPPLFFLDEPTSGLDSFTAIKIVDILKALAHSGRTVVATLHQPSSQMFAIFDDLVVMSAGHIVYSGPASKSVVVFGTMGYPLPENCNPADHIVSVINVSTPDEIEKTEKMANSYAAILTKTTKEEVQTEVNRVKMVKKDINKPGPVQQTWMLFSKRSVRHYFRTPSTTYMRAAQVLFFSLICGVLFFNLGYTQSEVMAKNGALFFILTNMAFNSVFNVVLVIPIEKNIFNNEISNGMYSVVSYFFSKVLIEMPINIIVVLIYQLILYWMIGLANTASQFFNLFLILTMATNTGYFLGMFIGVIAPSSDLATAMSSFILLPSMLFSGFFIKPEDMEPWISWLTYINFFRYLMDMAVYNEFNDNESKYQVCIPGTTNCSMVTGKDIQKMLDLQDLKFWSWYAISAAFMFGWCFATLGLLLLKSDKKVGQPLEEKRDSL